MSTRHVLAAIVIATLVAGCGTAATPAPSAGPSASAAAGPTATVATPSTTPSTSPEPVATPTASPSPSLEPSSEPTATPTATPTTEPEPTMAVRAYFLLDDRSGGDPAIVPVLRTVPIDATTARPGLTALLAGPSSKESSATPRIRSLVPAGTELLAVRISKGTAIVDLSGAFTASADVFTIRARLAQVVFTATQEPTVDRVVIHVEGQAIGSGAGWTLAREPMTRATFRDLLLPAIFVDRPAWGASYLSGTEITGLANVFEAQFRIALRDAAGSVLAERSITASCGSGCWGAWATSLTYDVSRAQWGQLRVWDISEADGTVIDLRSYPVWLRP